MNKILSLIGLRVTGRLVILLRFAFTSLFIAAVPTPAMAQAPNGQPTGWMWGVGVAASQDVYIDFDSRVIPIPIIGYVGERLRITGPFIGYQVYKQGAVTIDAQLVPIFAGYEEDDSIVFDGMNDRDFSYGAGASIRYTHKGINYTLAANADILDRFNGYQASARVSKPFRMGAFTLAPALAVNYQDSNYVDYYYGVLPEEARTFRPVYRGDGALNTEVSFALSTPIFFGGITRLQVGATFYDDSISDSPLTDSDSALSAMLMYSRFF